MTLKSQVVAKHPDKYRDNATPKPCSAKYDSATAAALETQMMGMAGLAKSEGHRGTAPANDRGRGATNTRVLIGTTIRASIEALLAERGPMTTNEISRALGRHNTTMSNHLRRMAVDGRLLATGVHRKTYRIPAGGPVQITRGKLGADDVREIRRRVQQGELQQAIADDYGVGRATISRIKRGENWSKVE
jgi:DNA invertase Pin-like site-specific DNA recombinase